MSKICVQIKPTLNNGNEASSIFSAITKLFVKVEIYSKNPEASIKVNLKYSFKLGKNISPAMVPTEITPGWNEI